MIYRYFMLTHILCRLGVSYFRVSLMGGITFLDSVAEYLIPAYHIKTDIIFALRVQHGTLRLNLT